MSEGGNAYVAMEKEGAVLEKIRHLKQIRGGAKGEFTKKANELTELLEGHDGDAVWQAAEDLSTNMVALRALHLEFFSLLVDESEKEDAEGYLDEVKRKFSLMQEEAKSYLERADAEKAVRAKAGVEIAHSIAGSRTSLSTTSSKARATAAAKRPRLQP